MNRMCRVMKRIWIEYEENMKRIYWEPAEYMKRILRVYEENMKRWGKDYQESTGWMLSFFCSFFVFLNYSRAVSGFRHAWVCQHTPFPDTPAVVGCPDVRFRMHSLEDKAAWVISFWKTHLSRTQVPVWEAQGGCHRPRGDPRDAQSTFQQHNPMKHGMVQQPHCGE